MKGDLKNTVLNWITMFVIVLILIAGMVTIYPNYRRGETLKRQNQELRDMIERKKLEIAQLRDYQRRFRTDPDFVELIARLNRRVFPGELVFIYDKE